MSGIGTIFGGATLFGAGALAGQATLLPLAGSQYDSDTQEFRRIGPHINIVEDLKKVCVTDRPTDNFKSRDAGKTKNPDLELL